MGLVFLSYSKNPTPFRLSVVGEVTLSQVVPLSLYFKMFPELPTATNVSFQKMTVFKTSAGVVVGEVTLSQDDPFSVDLKIAP